MKNSCKHLDLGCGTIPRNPYSAASIYGVDIRDIQELDESDFIYKQANLTLERIPFPDDFFDSVSAFDFLEHIPRQITTPEGNLVNPFIKLMNEIYRVLKPGGKFFALTPVYPHPSVFVDPTHVNFITKKTHKYFTGITPYGRMYGFTGNFKIIKVKRDSPKNIYNDKQCLIKKIFRRVNRILFDNGLSHIVWEFVADKN